SQVWLSREQDLLIVSYTTLFRSQFGHGATVNIAFESHHIAQREPVTDPAPAVEFGFISGTDVNTGIIADEFQQKPLLFLPHTDRATVVTNHAARQPVTQPAPGAAQNLYLLRAQANFFLQFTE